MTDQWGISDPRKIIKIIKTDPPTWRAVSNANCVLRVSWIEEAVFVVLVGVFSLFHPHLNDTVAAPGDLAGIGAFVAIDEIAVVAGLDPGLHKAISAAGRSAGIGALIQEHFKSKGQT